MYKLWQTRQPRFPFPPPYPVQFQFPENSQLFNSATERTKSIRDSFPEWGSTWENACGRPMGLPTLYNTDPGVLLHYKTYAFLTNHAAWFFKHPGLQNPENLICLWALLMKQMLITNDATITLP